jgi:hypothetical protein
MACWRLLQHRRCKLAGRQETRQLSFEVGSTFCSNSNAWSRLAYASLYAKDLFHSHQLS